MGGVNKSLIEVEGMTIIDRQLKILRPLFDEIILAGWPPSDPVPDDVIIVRDNYNGIGPLAGIEAAMRAAKSQYVFVFGGDMPWLSEEIIAGQAEIIKTKPAPVILPRVGDRIEPLHALYRRDLHGSLVWSVTEGKMKAVRDFIAMSHPEYIYLADNKITFRAFANINSSDDLLVG